MFSNEIGLKVGEIVSIFALVISLVVFWHNNIFARKNIKLSIQQILIKTINEKARDCNIIWDTIKKQADSAPRFIPVISELIITQEIIVKNFEMYQVNYKNIFKLKSDLDYLLWKQLRTDLREWFMTVRFYGTDQNNKIYSQQIKDLFIVFSEYFENQEFSIKNEKSKS